MRTALCTSVITFAFLTRRAICIAEAGHTSIVAFTLFSFARLNTIVVIHTIHAPVFAFFAYFSVLTTRMVAKRLFDTLGIVARLSAEAI